MPNENIKTIKRIIIKSNRLETFRTIIASRKCHFVKIFRIYEQKKKTAARLEEQLQKLELRATDKVNLALLERRHRTAVDSVLVSGRK